MPSGLPVRLPACEPAAEELPFEDASFDAAMAVLSDHHWREDRLQGLRELRRVAHRVVLFNADPAQASRFWLTTDYLPGFCDLIPEPYRVAGYWESELAREGLGALHTFAVPHPARLPRRVLCGLLATADGIPGPQRPNGDLGFRAPRREGGRTRPAHRLRADLRTGAWEARHAALLQLDQLDLGYRVAIAEPAR